LDGEQWERKYIGSRSIFLKSIPSDAFVEIYLGENSYRDQRRKYDNLIDGYKVPKILQLKEFSRNNNIELFTVLVDTETWSLKRKIINSVDLD
jgi:hypothetical protein